MAALQLPVLSDRLRLASDYAGMSPAQVRKGLEAAGIHRSKNYIYKLFSGALTNPSYDVIAGLSMVLGTDARWFCEQDADGSIERALVAQHRQGGSQPQPRSS